MAGGVEAEPEKAAITERVDRAEASTEAALMVEARARNTREKAFPVLHLLPNEIALTSEARHLFCSIMPELIHYGYPLERLKRKGPNHDPPEPVSFVCYQPILSLIHLPGQGRERKWTADGGRVRFQDKAVDCHEPVDEAHLVRICIEGTLREYRVHLVNLNFQTFSQLIEAAINLKSTIKGSPWKTGRSSSSQVSAASASSNRKSQGEGSRSSKKRKQYDDPPPYPCTIEEVKALVKEWVADGEITLPEFQKKVDAKDLRFKKTEGEDVRRNPYPDHGEKGKNVNMVAYRGYHGVCDHELLDCFEEEDIFSVNVVTYHEEESANMASYYDEIEEIAGYEEPRAAPDPDAFAKTLQNCMKFRSFFDQLGLSNPARLDITKAWQHRYAAIPSSYHQCMKAKWGGKTITVDASERPFEVAEAHLDDAVFFTELSTEETAITAKPRGIKIPRWEDIKDQHDDEEVVLIQKRGSSNSKPFKQPARRYHPDLEEKIKEEIEKLRAAG
ncbi:hypothetical protein Acr_00g0003440 [Actinidia rufa]|uniref:Uncharacterized protein n=1 Tax=Actinidia rufa TaxID=165716 RepID=A0A7J0D768_9ERIC|nr:hypothetical protein Acr_00g0003440 [Actinidia rufa]